MRQQWSYVFLALTHRYGNSCCFPGHHILTNFCTCPNSTAVVSCAKFSSDHFITIWITAKKKKLCLILIMMEKSLIKWNLKLRSEGYLYSDIKMGAMASQITCVSTVYSIVCSGADHRKHQSSASLAFERGIHRWMVNSPHKGPVMQKIVSI